MFATVLCHQQTVHNEYFFLAQEDSQLHLVQRFGGEHSIIDFHIVSTDLFSSVVDVDVKRRVELSTNHHLVIFILRDLNHPRTRKQFRARKTYRINRELLANKKMRHTFASKIASLFREFPDFTEC